MGGKGPESALAKGFARLVLLLAALPRHVKRTCKEVPERDLVICDTIRNFPGEKGTPPSLGKSPSVGKNFAPPTEQANGPTSKTGQKHRKSKTENPIFRRRADYGFGEYGFKHRAH